MKKSKRWFKSKTVWANVIATGALVLNHLFGVKIDAETQAYLVPLAYGAVNLGLRFWTSSGIGK